jgi:hypothetical protein
VRGSKEWMGSRGNLGAILIFAGVVVSEIRLTRKRTERSVREETEENQDVSIDEEMET